MSKSTKDPETLPVFSVIIPARNEEKRLPSCLKALRAAFRAAGGCSHEIIVVINRCEDKTEEVAKAEGCSIVHSEAKNLAMIRNAGAQNARGEFLITVDADSTVSENIFTEILKNFRNRNVIGGGVIIYPERWSMGIFLTALCLLPIILWHRILCGLFFCRRTDFHAIGGFNEKLASVEDIDFAKRLKAYGKKTGRSYVNLFRASIITSTRKFDTFGDWYFLRNPGVFLKLLEGKNQKLADKVWYDYKE